MGDQAGPAIVNDEPLFSIIMPTYNRARLLARAIRSVLGQTFKDFELMVVDDGSTDDTRQVVEGFADPRIRYLYQENAGAALARNLGAEHARGAVLLFLDSDDEALSEWLEHYANAFEEPGLGLVCSGAVWVTESDQSHTETLSLPRNYGSIYNNQTVLFLSGTYALHRELFEAVGGYKNKPSRQSADLAMRVVPYCLDQGWAIRSISLPLVRLYKHEDDRIGRDVLAQYEGAKANLQDYGDLLLTKSPKRYAMYCGVAGSSAFRLGKYREARSFFWQALRHYPWRWKYHAAFFLSLFPPVGQIIWRRGRDS